MNMDMDVNMHMHMDIDINILFLVNSIFIGSRLVVNCNITDTRDNTNLRCWRVNGTLVDIYYEESKRIQEGIE